MIYNVYITIGKWKKYIYVISLSLFIFDSSGDIQVYKITIITGNGRSPKDELWGFNLYYILVHYKTIYPVLFICLLKYLYTQSSIVYT